MSTQSPYVQGPAKVAIYPRSLPILSSLAKRFGQQTLPDPASSRDDYLDHSLAILGKGVTQIDDMVRKKDLDKGLGDLELRLVKRIDALEERQEVRFQAIDTRFQGIDARFQGIDERFQGIDARFREVDARFDQLELRMNRKIDALEERIEVRFQAIDARFAEIDRRLDRLEERFDHLDGRFDNFQAVQRNGKRFKLYHRIEVIKAYKLNPQTGRCQWTASPDFPKHLKALRNLGNHAKGRWTREEVAELSPAQRNGKQDRALAALERLLDFYGVQVFADDRSESDATELALSPDNVDEHMEALADEWGLEWHDIARIPDDEPNVLAAKKRGSMFWEYGRHVRAREE